MAITRERFNTGLTYQELKALLKQQGRETFETNERNAPIGEAELAPFKKMANPLDVLVIVTETCPDVLMNVPILWRIAEATSKLNMRIFLRDDHKDLMADYMNGPYESVPVFVFFDEGWKELGVFIERPRSVTEYREGKTREIYASDPRFGSPDAPPSDLPEDVRSALQQAIRQMRTDTMPVYARETVRDLGEMISEISSGITGRRRGNLAVVPA